jgi:hypothetical protein
VIVPREPLDVGPTYQVSVSGDVTDLVGNRMGADYVWQFGTQMTPELPVYLPLVRAT